MVRNRIRDVIEVKEDVEGDPVPDEAGVGAVPVVEDGLDGVFQVLPWTVESYRDGSLPSLKERLQVVQEGEVAVSGEGDGLVTVEVFVPHHQVTQHPELLPQSLQ